VQAFIYASQTLVNGAVPLSRLFLLLLLLHPPLGSDLPSQRGKSGSDITISVSAVKGTTLPAPLLEHGIIQPHNVKDKKYI